MTEIVINKRHGGFGLSPLATREYLKLKGKKCYFYIDIRYDRSSPSYLITDPTEEHVYKRISMKDAEKSFVTYTFTRDFGKTFTGKFPETEKFPDGDYFYDADVERDDPDLVKVVKKLGKKANDDCAELEIVEIPDDVKWEINDYDGWETIHERHRSWG